MKTAYFWLTSKAEKIAKKLAGVNGGDVFPKENFSGNVVYAFENYEALVFIMASGIAVRHIAPLIRSKTSDPAVLVISQNAEFVISLLSGHLGGANMMACRLAEIIGAVPVITTATDTENIIAFDEYARQNNMAVENPAEIKFISSELIEGGKIDVIAAVDTGINEQNIALTSHYRGNISVVIDKGLIVKNPVSHVLYLRPRIIHIGTGCKKNTDKDYFEECFLDFLKKNGVSIHSVKRLSTIPLKSEEKCIKYLCEKYGFQLKTAEPSEIEKYSAEFEGSEFVKSITGTSSVAEGSCYISSGKGSIICRKTKYSGITFAIAEEKDYKFAYTRYR